MSSDDTKELLQHATSSVDFYELLGVQAETNENEIRRAYRKESIKWHPDKNPDPSAVDKFHALAIAKDILLNPEAKAAYDKARAAREQKKRRHDALEGKRKQMVEELERREAAHFKRKREEDDAEERMQQEIRRLAEDGKRRRMELAEKRRKEAEEATATAPEEDQEPILKPAPVSAQAPEVDRTVVVKWFREGEGEALTKESLSDMFSRFGLVEHAFLSSREKKVRLSGEKHRRRQATGFVIFQSAFAAKSAVEAGAKSLPIIDTVEFASKKKEPNDNTDSPPATPTASPGSFTRSFRSSFAATPKNGSNGAPSFSFSPSQNSPSLEEATMARLRAAQKKRMEEEIRREEAAEAAED